MDYVHLPTSPDEQSTPAETTETHSVRSGNEPQISRGGDASDILPDRILQTQIQSSRRFKQNTASPASTIRGEFAQLQRELEVKIHRFDRTYDVCYEDSELIIYPLDRQKDYEYILDFCEVENIRLRKILIELMRAIATDRTNQVDQYPLVIRKPQLFRSGERHLRRQL